MRKRIKILLICPVLCLLVFAFSAPVSAQATQYDMEQDGLPLEEYLLEESWADFFESQPFSIADLQDKTLPEIFFTVWQAAKSQIREPLRIAARVTAVLLLVGTVRLLNSENLSPELNYTLQSVLTVTVFLLLSAPVLQLLEDSRQALDSCRLFLAQFVPVLGGVLAAGGQPATAAVYSTVFFSVIIAVSQALYSWVAPLIRVFLALSITRGLCGSLRLDGFIGLLRKVIHWVMGLTATLFGAYLSFQSVIANAGDSIAMRAGKFVLSGGIPIVGGAVSDAIGTVYAGLKLVKSAAGVLGILGLLLLFAPLLVKCLAYGLVCSACAATAQLLDNAPAKGLLEGMADSIRMLGAILVLYLLLLVLSVALMLLLTAGGA